MGRFLFSHNAHMVATLPSIKSWCMQQKGGCVNLIEYGSYHCFNFAVVVDMQCSFNFCLQPNDPVLHTHTHTHTHTFFFCNTVFHHVLTQVTVHSFLCCTVGSSYPTVWNVIVGIYQLQTPHSTSSVPPSPGKHKSALHAHDLFLFCR